MRRHAILSAVLLLGAATTVMAAEPKAARDAELAREPSWAAPAVADVQRRALAWASEVAGLEGAARAEPIWKEIATGAAGADLIDAAMATAAVVDPRAAAVRAGPLEASGGLGWLDAQSTSDFGRQAVTLWLGRELVRRDRFDEALPLLADLDVTKSVDPAALLFHRGCCQHWLLDREAALESFDRLLEREAELPARFARLARLLRADIAGVRSDSLDHIARRMRDVRRRLDLGYAGPETRRVQAGVIESLDKLIEELEQQRQQQSRPADGREQAGPRPGQGRGQETGSRRRRRLG